MTCHAVVMDKDGNVSGTSLCGYVVPEVSFEQLTQIFGTPIRVRNSDGKVRVTWQGHINDLLFTIYDYQSELPLNKNTDWHIGGCDHRVVSTINQHIGHRLHMHMFKSLKIRDVYCNNGSTLDKYTVFFRGGGDVCLSLSDNPGHPLGVYQWGLCGARNASTLGRRIAAHELPDAVRQYIYAHVR